MISKLSFVFGLGITSASVGAGAYYLSSQSLNRKSSIDSPVVEEERKFPTPNNKDSYPSQGEFPNLDKKEHIL